MMSLKSEPIALPTFWMMSLPSPLAVPASKSTVTGVALASKAIVL